MMHPAVPVLFVTQQAFQEWIPVLSALGSLVLTGALVYLYFRQTRIQEQQADLQADQQALLEAQAQAIVEPGPVDVEGEAVYVTLSNVGGGVATGLQCVTTVEFDDREDIEPCETAVPLERHIQRAPGGGSDGFTMVRGTNSLRPYTDDTPFVGNPTLGIEADGKRREYAFANGVDYLVENDVTELRCSVFLEYTDALGHTEREVLLAGGGQLDRGTVLSELVAPL